MVTARPRRSRAVSALTGVALVAVAFGGFTPRATAQLSTDDVRCIATFNKSLRSVAKTHARIVRKCLTSFAAGRLTGSTPEECIAADPGGKLADTVAKATTKVDQQCSAGLPGFGATQIDLALVRAVLAQYDLMHTTIGPDLNVNLITNGVDAACQAKAGGALLKCEDARLREYVKCQNRGMKSGQIVDGASLAATCLGTGNGQQPDDAGGIALKCGTKVADTVLGQCDDTNLALAFAPCNPLDAATLSSCLTRQSACQLCRLLNDVGGVVRDCDAFDDGNDTNGSCVAECGDSHLQIEEACDDSNQANNDGCSDQCTVEGGWTCTGEPSVCTLNCGNGELDAGESCDDDDNDDGDGCTHLCEVESGYSCTGEPSVCTPNCGNGSLNAGEACDDDDADNGDGCSSTCQVEPGYNCAGEPSVCTFVCGNGTFQSGETCDDGDAAGGDGCSAICKIETGWLCSGAPSLCTPTCGDGLIRGPEACDDGDATSGDGCTFACQVEPGFQCTGQPSTCTAICGDGFLRGFETCDDHNTMSGDGCSGNLCLREANFACLGQPSVCIFECGDGNLDGLEQCDDGDNTNGDGCAGNCTTEPGYACAGQPSLCFPTCGNGVLDGGEECDDGDATNGDGCTASCRTESGWLCPTPGLSCQKFDVFIDSPAHGIFTTASSILVTGHYTTLVAGEVSVKVNGVPASSVNTTLRTFSHTVALSQAQAFNPILVTVTHTPSGDDVRDRVVVIAGQSVADGDFSPQSVAMRLNDTGLDSIEPLVATLATGQLNIGDLIPSGTVITDSCFIDSFLGCLGSARVTIANPPPSYGSLNLLMDSQVNSVYGDIGIFNLRLDVDIAGSGLVPNCGLRLTANAMHLTGNYALEPLPSDLSSVDVNLVTNPIGVAFAGFNRTFTSGLCDAPIIGDIIQSLLPDIEALAVDGIKGFLSDPDGAGVQDSPIAAAIQSVLGGISITGPVGAGLGLMLETPLFAVTEDNSGVTLGSNSRFYVSVGSGPGQCIPPPGAPDFTRSYSKFEAFPVFGATTPVAHVPYGLGINISSAGFNQLLKGQTECGLMRSSLTTIDLDGGGPVPPLAINSTLLSALIPEFGQLPPNTPLRIDIAPTLAPITTGNAGPHGELTELKISHIALDVVEPGPETVWLSGALDARLGMNLAFLPDGSGLAITIATPDPGDLTVAIIGNPLGADPAQVETVLPSVIQPLIPSLAGALSGFPLPEFFGLSLQGVEVSRTGQFMGLYANLAPVP